MHDLLLLSPIPISYNVKYFRLNCLMYCLHPQAADRSFLEELLMYLRQQRRQLDESRRLLEHLEQQQREEETDGGSIPASAHIDATVSGTIPSVATPSQPHPHSRGVGELEGADLQGHVGPTRVVSMGTQAGAGTGAAARSGGRLDLSSLYEQREC